MDLSLVRVRSRRLILGQVKRSSFCFLLSVLSTPGLGTEEILAQDTEPAQFRVEVYATLHEVRVNDPEGNPVRGLKREDFRVLEEGKHREVVHMQEADNVPVTIGLLLDTGTAMSEAQIRIGKKLIFDLIHLLDPVDEILLATYDREEHFLSPLTSNRLELIEALQNVSPGGRPGWWSRFARLFASDGNTGFAVDQVLLKLRSAAHSDRSLVVISAAFGSVGEATLDHIRAAGVRFFAVRMSNRAGDAFNLGGDQSARKRIVEGTGGISYDGETVLERIEQIRDTLKHYYLVAYDPADIQKGILERKVRFSVANHSEYSIHVTRQTRSVDSLFGRRVEPGGQ